LLQICSCQPSGGTEKTVLPGICANTALPESPYKPDSVLLLLARSPSI